LQERQKFSDQEGVIAVKHVKTVNVWFVAKVSALVYGTMAAIFMPLLSTVMLSFGALPAPLAGVITAEHGMVFAVVAPFGYAAFGLGFGALMAFLFNMFVNTLLEPKPSVVPPPTEEVEEAAVGEAA
jgi:hypothetical protein